MQNLVDGWPMILAYPKTFLAITIAIFVVTWFLISWFYSRVLASKNAQIELQDRQLSDYREKLKVATPDEAKAKIQALQERVHDTSVELHPAPRVSAPLKPDIDARLAFFRVLESSAWRKEQETKTPDTRHMVYDWLEVQLRNEIHVALRNSRLASWGEECLPGTATTPEKPIPPETWDKVEISFDRSSLSRTGAHFKGPTRRELGRMAWVGVRFSSDQLFEMFPLISSDANAWRPVCVGIQHISQRIGDIDESNCFERTRLALRQAAYDKRVRLRAKKQMTEPSPFAGRKEYSDIYTDVDSGYWINSNINALATSYEMHTSHHTDPQTAYAWGKLGMSERNRIYDLQLNWDDVLKEWP
jgi:hypothetical protein